MAQEESQNPFETTAASEDTMSQSERYYRRLDVSLIAPFKIVWDDLRARVGLLIILAYIAAGTIGVVVIPAPTGDAPRLVQPMQQGYLLGTDKFGNSMVRATIHATPAMLKMIIAGSVITTGVATVVGTVAGYKAGIIDRIVTTITDIMMTIPGLPLVIVLAVALEPRDPFVVGVILSVNAWAGLARTLRSQVLSIRNESYVEASRVIGDTTPNIIYKDVLPNIMPYVLVNFMNSARNIIINSVGLYFLGVLPFTTLNWGVMMNLAYQAGAMRIASIRHWLIIPIVAITLLSIGLIMFSQGLDRIYNPRIRARHSSAVGDEEAPAN